MNNTPILPPFKRFCVTIGNLPSSYVDSMSYYECIMWLCNYLQNTVIPAVNENAEAVNELINWFNNLDVTEEVNAKLDRMVEDGTLLSMVKPYFDNYVQPEIDEINENFDSLSNSVNNRIIEQNNKIDQQDSVIDNINNKVDSAVTGTPLVASSIDDMTDTTRIYVNTTDGKWYYYNGETWEIGGTYQTTGIADGELKEKMFYNPVSLSDNLFNKQYYHSGYINGNDTVVSGTSGAGLNIYTDYIPIDSHYKNLTINTYCNLHCYNSNKVSIQYYQGSDGRYIEIPEGTAYIRCSLIDTNLDNTMIIYGRAGNNIKYKAYKFYSEKLYSKNDINYFDDKLKVESLTGYKLLSDNLLNNSIMEKGILNSYGILRSPDEEDTQFPNGVVTDYIEIEPSVTYYVGKGRKTVSFYDQYKGFISGTTYTNTGIFVSPATAKYIRICTNEENKFNICLIKQSTTKASTFKFSIPYLTNEKYDETSDVNPFDKAEILYDEMFNCRSNKSDQYITDDVDSFGTKKIILNASYNNNETTRLTYYFIPKGRMIEIDFDSISSIASNLDFEDGNIGIGIRYITNNGANYSKVGDNSTYIYLNNQDLQHKKIRYPIPANCNVVRLVIFARQYYRLDIKNINVKFVDRATNGIRGNIEFVGHQGLPELAPKNTIPSFEYAIYGGFESCVINVNYTSDGELVVLHDDTIDSTSNGTGNIHTMTYQEVSQYDFGSWFGEGYSNVKIPKLEEVLLLFAKTGVKPVIRWNDLMTDPTLISKLFGLLEQYNLKDKTTILGFDIDILLGLKSSYPDYQYGYSGDGELNSTLIGKLHQLGDNVIFDRAISSITAEEVATCREEGFKVSTWFINRPEHLYPAIALGVDYIKTDFYCLQNCEF